MGLFNHMIVLGYVKFKILLNIGLDLWLGLETIDSMARQIKSLY